MMSPPGPLPAPCLVTRRSSPRCAPDVHWTDSRMSSAQTPSWDREIRTRAMLVRWARCSEANAEGSELIELNQLLTAARRSSNPLPRRHVAARRPCRLDHGARPSRKNAFEPSERAGPTPWRSGEPAYRCPRLAARRRGSRPRRCSPGSRRDAISPSYFLTGALTCSVHPGWRMAHDVPPASMVRNFQTRTKLLLKPCRSCRKNTGPGLSGLISRATSSMSGEASARSRIPSTRSSASYQIPINRHQAAPIVPKIAIVASEITSPAFHQRACVT